MAEPSTNDEGEVVTDTSISWPLNRQGMVYRHIKARYLKCSPCTLSQ